MINCLQHGYNAPFIGIKVRKDEEWGEEVRMRNEERWGSEEWGEEVRWGSEEMWGWGENAKGWESGKEEIRNIKLGD